MSETQPAGWDPGTARRFIVGFGLLSLSSLVVGVEQVMGISRTARDPFIAGMLIGSWTWWRAYVAAGKPSGRRFFFVGRDAALTAGWSPRVWDVVVVAQLVALTLPLVALVT